MARAQVYRGNPEVKQTILFDNFSGGMNTTSIDDQMLTNEFRMLKNVEIIEQGRVRKRKGFQISESISDKLVGTKFKTALVVYYFSLVNNVIETIFYSSTDGLNYVVYDLTPEIIYENIIFPKDIRLQGNFNRNKYTGLNVQDYNGFKYFLSNEIFDDRFDIIKFGKDDDGDYQFNIYNKYNSFKPTPWDVGVFGEGFNLFSESPHKYIGTQNTSTKTIQGLILTLADDENKIISEIPSSGEFKLFVYYTGEIDPDELEIKFYQREYDEEEEKNYIENISITNISNLEDVGYFTYYVKFNDLLSGDISLDVSLEKTVNLQDSAIEIAGVNNLTDLINHFSNIEKPEMIYDVHQDKHTITTYIKNNNSTYEYIQLGTESYINNAVQLNQHSTDKYYYKVNHTGIPVFDNKDKYVLKWAGGILTRYYGKLVGPSEYPNMDLAVYVAQPNRFSQGQWLPEIELNVHVNPGDSCDVENKLVQHASASIPPGFPGNFVVSTVKCVAPYVNYNAIFDETKTKVVTSDIVSNVNKEIINLDNVYKIGENYYRWNGKNTGSIEDFDDVMESNKDVMLSFTMDYLISKSLTPEVEEIKDIDFSGSKMLIIRDRMVVYKENTIFWSSDYSTMKDVNNNEQEFSYFPHVNWVTLPLPADDSIQTINYYRGSYMVFTKEAIYRMSGHFNMPDFEIVLVNDAIGCISPNSVRSFNNTLQFMSKDGLYILKQNYYMDGMENVEKVDKLITNIIPFGYNYESFMYNEQYWLIIKDEFGDYIKTIKQYYNMESSNRKHPFTLDELSSVFDLIFKVDNKLFAIKNNEVYEYDKGFYDFGEKYETVIETGHLGFGYQLHEKKFKNIFLNTEASSRKPVYFKLLFDKALADDYIVYDVELNQYGELVYIPKINDKYMFELTGKFVLDEGILGEDYLGQTQYQVHKINASNKGRYIKIIFVIDEPVDFAIDSINFVYKLGKMRERRG